MDHLAPLTAPLPVEVRTTKGRGDGLFTTEACEPDSVLLLRLGTANRGWALLRAARPACLTTHSGIGLGPQFRPHPGLAPRFNSDVSPPILRRELRVRPESSYR